MTGPIGAVRATVEPPVAIVTLGRGADDRNHLSLATVEELSACLRSLADDADPDVVLLSSASRVFSVGADLREVLQPDEAAVERYIRAGQALVSWLRGARAVTIAAVGGLALGGGLELALACDLRWAHPRAVFGLPEAGIGLVPAWGGARLIRETLPAAVAAEVVCGRRLGAAQALQYGLVSRVIAARDFHAEAGRQAQRLARDSRTPLTLLKRLWALPVDGRAADIEREALLSCLPGRGGTAG